MAKIIRNIADLEFEPGNLVYIDHQIASISKRIHNRIEKHLDCPALVLAIVKKEDYTPSFQLYEYYVYSILVGDDKLEFSEDVLSSTPIRRPL